MATGRIEYTGTGETTQYTDSTVIIQKDVMPARGWITEISVRARAVDDQNLVGNDAFTTMIYADWGSKPALFISPQVFWNETMANHTFQIDDPPRFDKDAIIHWGLYSGGTFGVIVDGAKRTGGSYKSKKVNTTAPTLLPTTWDATVNGETIRGWLEYVKQEKPLKPAWFSDSPTGVVPTSSPEVHGNSPQGGDASVDYIDTVQIKAYETGNPDNVYMDKVYDLTSSESRANNWRRNLEGLPAGSEVTIEFRTEDSWGEWSVWSDPRSFSVTPGPDKPTVTRPSGRINYRNQAEYQAQGGVGNLYAGSYNNPNGVGMHSVWVEVWNRERSTRLKSSGWVNRTAASGVWTLPEWVGHGLYDYAQELSIRAKVRELAPNGIDPGIESSWGDFTDVATNAPPNKPTNLMPGDGMATGTPDFIATVADPDNDPITAAIMRVNDIETNQLVILASGRTVRTAYSANDVRRPSAANGHRYRANVTGHSSDITSANLGWPTTSGGTVKDIPSTAIANSTTYAVGNCRLRRGGTTAQALFYECTAITTGITAATEPAAFATATAGQTIVDGGVTWTVRTAITWTEIGPDTERFMNVTGNTLDFNLAGFLTLGKEYYWQAKASDAIAYGNWSEPANFRFVLVPSATILAPHAQVRRNWIEDPSFENALSTWWTKEGTNATNTISVSGENAAEGSSYMRFVLDGTAQSASARIISPLKPVDATKTWLLQAEMREVVGSGRFNVQVICKNASGTTVGTINPSSLLVANGTDPAGAALNEWARYGGVIWPIGSANTPAFPSGTTQAQVAIYAQSTAVAGGVTADVDAVAFESIATLTNNTQAGYAQMWARFFDGSSDYSNAETSPYNWIGTVNQSESEGIPVLSNVGGRFYYRYTTSSGLNQNARQLEIEKLVGDEYEKIYDSGMVLSNVAPNTIDFLTLPLNVLSSQHRYRATLTVRDTGLINAKITPIEFDVMYYGPPELDILSATVDTERGALLMQWEETALTTDFDGYQVARKAPGEPFKIFETITDPANVGAEYPYPVPNQTYDLFVRQRQRPSGQRVEGRWTKVTVEAEFPEIFYLKDPVDTTLVLPMDIRQQDPPAMESAPTNFGSYRPYEESERVHWGPWSSDTSEAYVFHIWDDDPQKFEKVRIIEDFRKKPRTLILLAQRPDEKMAVYPRRISRTRGATPLYASYSIEFEESSFDEDATKKEGAA